jgi:tRNA (guanine-N7-)-methyltransferase
MWYNFSDYPDIILPTECVEQRETIGNLFPGDQPLEVDIGSGKGRFILARAATHPNIRFLGIERQANRIYKVAKKAHRQGITNMRLILAEATDALEVLLPDAGVATFYLFFPDPWPKRRHHRRRLINVDFLDLIHRKLQSGGALHFATDHQDYADVVARLFNEDSRFESIPEFQPTEEERTDFELVFSGLKKPITRLSIKRI